MIYESLHIDHGIVASIKGAFVVVENDSTGSVILINDENIKGAFVVVENDRTNGPHYCCFVLNMSHQGKDKKSILPQ